MIIDAKIFGASEDKIRKSLRKLHLFIDEKANTDKKALILFS